MKKPTLALTAATAMMAATLALVAPAVASAPSNSVPWRDDCSVHVWYNGADVNVNWC
jgi:hypothetical protein